LISGALHRLRVIFLANPQLSPDETRALFERVAPAGHAPLLSAKQVPIAAYMDAQQRWVVLTSKQPACVQTYSVALNYALQALLGLNGAPLPRRRRVASA
jgi:hypothetical protein